MRIANAIAGAAIGGGALCWTLAFGEALHALGHDALVPVLWAAAAVQTLAVGLIVALCDPARHLKPRAGLEGGSTEAALSLSELGRDWRVYLFVFVMEGWFFAGISMKTLLSVLFEEILALEYIHAVRYSAACLAFYGLARSLSPLVSAGDRVFHVFAAVLCMECVAYGLTPWAVGPDGPREYRKELYTCFRLAGGAGFAILSSNTTVLLVRIFGVHKVTRISGLFLCLEFLAGLGPSVAFVLHVERMKEGGKREQSYDPFFYFCSALVGAGAIGLAVLKRSVRSREARTGPAPDVVGRATA